jgi:hypothetical protein
MYLENVGKADNDKEVLFLFKIDSIEKNESANLTNSQALWKIPKLIYPP